MVTERSSSDLAVALGRVVVVGRRATTATSNYANSHTLIIQLNYSTLIFLDYSHNRLCTCALSRYYLKMRTYTDDLHHLWEAFLSNKILMPHTEIPPKSNKTDNIGSEQAIETPTSRHYIRSIQYMGTPTYLTINIMQRQIAYFTPREKFHNAIQCLVYVMNE